MAFRREFLKWVYPLFRWASGKGKNGVVLENKKNTVLPASFYALKAVGNNGETMAFSSLRGKYVLIVNTATDCGFTPQYAQLQQLYEANKERLIILAFPSNDFKQQEPYTDKEIATFCSRNYGVSFPIMQKAAVTGLEQHPVYKWLTSAANNGWNNHTPDWNFSKYLINTEGVLTHYFGPAVLPAEVGKYLTEPAGVKLD